MSSVITGRLDMTSCAEIIKILSLGKKTGILGLTNGNDRGSIYFSNGTVINAEHQNIAGLKALYEIALWREGQYSFIPQETSIPKVITVSTDEIINEIKIKLSQRDIISSSIHSGEIIFELNPDTKLSDINLKPIQWKVITNINGRLKISDIARKLGILESDAMKVFYTLFQMDLIKDIKEKSNIKIASDNKKQESRVFNEIKDILSRHIGPIAPLILKETAAELNVDSTSEKKETFTQLIMSISEKIPDKNVSDAFIDSIAVL